MNEYEVAMLVVEIALLGKQPRLPDGYRVEGGGCAAGVLKFDVVAGDGVRVSHCVDMKRLLATVTDGPEDDDTIVFFDDMAELVVRAVAERRCA